MLGANGDLLSGNLYAYCSNNPVNYSDPSGNAGELVGSWISSMWWLCAVDWILPIGDIIYVVGIGVTAAFEFLVANPNLIDMTQLAGEKTAEFIDSIRQSGSDTASPNGQDPNDWEWTKNNYRTNFQRLYGNLPQDYQVHHTLPQKYESIMRSSGINIHNPQYLKAVHKTIHYNINEAWRVWDKGLGRMPSASEVIDFAKKIDTMYSKFWH